MRLEAFCDGVFAIMLYGGLAIVAEWLPLLAAIATTASWAFWSVIGIRMKRA